MDRQAIQIIISVIAALGILFLVFDCKEQYQGKPGFTYRVSASVPGFFRYPGWTDESTDTSPTFLAHDPIDTVAAFYLHLMDFGPTNLGYFSRDPRPVHAVTIRVGIAAVRLERKRDGTQITFLEKPDRYRGVGDFEYEDATPQHDK